jgi:hypothetical protein
MENAAPWGSIRTALRNPGASVGGMTMVPPKLEACWAITSASETWRLTFQCGGRAGPALGSLGWCHRGDDVSRDRLR